MYQANILLVDDETAILQLLTTILEKEGFSHITTATSAEIALSLTKETIMTLQSHPHMKRGVTIFFINLPYWLHRWMMFSTYCFMVG